MVLFPKQLYTTYNFGGAWSPSGFCEGERGVVIHELIVPKGSLLTTFVDPNTRCNIGNHSLTNTWHSSKYHIRSMKTYLKPKWMEWFIYNENVNEGDERKDPKIYWKTPLLIALLSSRRRCGEPTVFQYPRRLKTSRIIPTWDERLNWSDKRDESKGSARSS